MQQAYGHTARLPGFPDSLGSVNRPSRYFNTPPAGQSQYSTSVQANEKNQSKGSKKGEKTEAEPQEPTSGLPPGWNPSGGRPQMNGTLLSPFPSSGQRSSFEQGFVMPPQEHVPQENQMHSNQFNQQSQSQAKDMFHSGKEYPFKAIEHQDYPTVTTQSKMAPQQFGVNEEVRTSGESSAEQLVSQSRNEPVSSTTSSANSAVNDGGKGMTTSTPMQVPNSTSALDLSEDKKMDRSETESPPSPQLVIATSPMMPQASNLAEPKLMVAKSHPAVSSFKQASVSYLYRLSNDPGRKLFVDKLIHFYNSSVNSAVHLPEFCGKPLDLYTLYQTVDEHGGLHQVITGKLWGKVAEALKADANQDHSSSLYKHYWTYLLPFVCQEQGLDMSVETLRLQQLEIEHGQDDKVEGDFGTQLGRDEPSEEIQPTLDDFNLDDNPLDSTSGNLGDADLPLPFGLTAEDLKEVESLFDSSQLDFDKPPELLPPPQPEPQPRVSQVFPQQQIPPIRSRAPSSGPPWSHPFSQPQMGSNSQQPHGMMYRQRSFPSWSTPPRQPYAMEQSRYSYLRERLPVAQPPRSELFNALQKRYLASQQHQQSLRHGNSPLVPQPSSHNSMVRQADVWHPPTPPNYHRSLSDCSSVLPQLGPRFPSVPRPDPRAFLDRHSHQSTALPRPPTDTWHATPPPPMSRSLQDMRSMPDLNNQPTSDVQLERSLSLDSQIHLSEERPTELKPEPSNEEKSKSEFPLGCVESTEASFSTRYKITAQMLGRLHPRQLIMSLKSGLLSECTWVLDALNILLYDDNTMPLFHLSRHPQLLDLLLDQFFQCLESIFGNCLSCGEGNNMDWSSIEGDWDGWSDNHADSEAENTSYIQTHLDADGQTIEKVLSKRWPLVDTNEEVPSEQACTPEFTMKMVESCGDVVCPEDGPFTQETDSQTNLGRRCCCISNVLRSLSYIPGNDFELCLHSRFLHLTTQVLSLHFEPWFPSKNDIDPTGICTGDKTRGREWWWCFLETLRENALVTLSNIAGQLNLGLLPQAVGHPLVETLVNWLVCKAPSAVNPFKGKLALSPRSLALEVVMKVALLEVNVDLILSTPTSNVLIELIEYLSNLLIDQSQPVLREFALVLLSCLLQGSIEEYACEYLKQSSRIVSHFISFLENAESGAAAAVLQARSFSFPLEAYGTTTYMLHRAALGVLALTKFHPPLFICYRQRLLSLSTSRLLDSYVSEILADALMHLSSL
jgi:hypothetical protein